MQDSFRYTQDGRWIGCDYCQQIQRCATFGHCGREFGAQQCGNSGQQNGISNAFGQSVYPSPYLQGNPMYQRMIVTSSPLDAGESDGGECD